MPASQNPPEKMMFQLNLRRRGISDQAVLRAMEEVPRELFVEPADRADAYRDSALGIACGQTISQPFVVAYMTEQLQLQKHHRVLEIGTGSGYQAAILSRLVPPGADDRALPDAGRQRPRPAGEARLRQCRGDAGRRFRRPARPPASSIASSSPRRWSRFPKACCDRLEPGGILIAPVGPHQGTQTLVRVTRTETGFDRKELVGRALCAGAAGHRARAVKLRISCSTNILFGG